MRSTRLATALVALTLASVALAQEPGPTTGTTPETTTETRTGETAAPAQPEKALELPQIADRMRSMGVPDKEVREVLNAAHSAKLPAAEAGDLLNNLIALPLPKEEEALNKLGETVEKNLDAGLRGDPLVNAVKAELTAKGMQEGAEERKEEAPEGERNVIGGEQPPIDQPKP